jgi:ABC-type uncharacterized transport system substrate-binding protein
LIKRQSTTWQHSGLGIFGALGSVSLATPVAAHPHVWVDMCCHSQISDDGKITGGCVQWTTDKVYAKDAFGGVDINTDGIYEPEDLARLAQKNLSAPSDYDDFVSLRFNSEKQKMEKLGMATRSTIQMTVV